MRSNNLSKFNAMKYLAKKHPEKYILKIDKFSVFNQCYTIELFEVVVDRKEHKFLNTVEKIEFKLNWEGLP